MDQETATRIGAAIAEALERKRPRLSQRKAAERAGIHESWWRQVTAGGVRKGDVWVPVKASPETYIDMAEVVGIVDEVRAMLGDDAPEPQQHFVGEPGDLSDASPVERRLLEMIDDVRSRLDSIEKRQRDADS